MAGHTCETYRPRPRHVQWDETDRMEPLQEWGGRGTWSALAGRAHSPVAAFSDPCRDPDVSGQKAQLPGGHWPERSRADQGTCVSVSSHPGPGQPWAPGF